MTPEPHALPPDPYAEEFEKISNSVINDFRQLQFNDPETGVSLSYNLFIPKSYDPARSYPLVLFIHDAGNIGTEPKITLRQGIGATIWATPLEQAKHECFVLAPQYPLMIVNDNSEAAIELDATVNLLKALCDEFNIDKNRLYTTGQSMGCMSSIAMMIKHPDLFAAALLVAGQWDAKAMSCLTEAHLWIIVSEGDLKAFPGMNASAVMLEAAGARISHARWNGQADKAEQAANVSKCIAEGNNINYTTLIKGTVVPAGFPDDGGTNHIFTWRIAYKIEGLRDWLFSQVRSVNK